MPSSACQCTYSHILCQVRTYNLTEHRKMRDLDPIDIDHLVSLCQRQ